MEHQTYFKASRRNKFGAKHFEYKGITYHSTMEGKYAAYLDMMKRAHNPYQKVVKWERQVKVPLIVNKKLIANWYCDFHVWFADGHDEWHEVKGVATDVFKIKEKLFRALFPDRLLLIVKRLP